MGANLLECILSSLCLSVLIIEFARISTEDSECCQHIALDSDDLLYLKEQMEAEYPLQLIISILDDCSSSF